MGAGVAARDGRGIVARVLIAFMLAASVRTARGGRALECAWDSREGAAAAEGAVPADGLPCSFGDCTFDTDAKGHLSVLGSCTSASPILYLNSKRIKSIAPTVFKNMPSTLRCGLSRALRI